ncbi:MAG: amino acid permease [Cyclobacteriaceae bacterium]|nr:amino acid permease [Cyclobacteriaceae bacterium]
MSSPADSTKYSLPVGIALVIANMIGTGVFTSLGYQVEPLPSGFAILMLWLLGGVVAWCGALTYAEIATTLERSGGEYLYLSKIYHPTLGFVSGWISTIAGFGGAISAVAIAIGSYSSLLIPLPEKVVSISCIIIISAIHLLGVKTGGRMQTILTSIKLFLIVFFCLAPFLVKEVRSGISFLPQPGDMNLILSSGFAVALVFVVYAYTGWNAAAYIAGNLQNARINLPKALLIGTLTVIVVYLALNGMFLLTTPMTELANQNDVGNVVAEKLFGREIGQIFSALFSIALLSTLSAMTIAGSRVSEAMGEDYSGLRFLAMKNRYGMPHWAVILQAGWSVFLVSVSTFVEIVQYISISLSIFSMLTVAGIFRLRKTHSVRPFQVPLYPLPPLIFIGVTCWMIWYMFRADPKIIGYSFATMIPGALLHLYLSRKVRPN